MPELPDGVITTLIVAVLPGWMTTTAQVAVVQPVAAELSDPSQKSPVAEVIVWSNRLVVSPRGYHAELWHPLVPAAILMPFRVMANFEPCPAMTRRASPSRDSILAGADLVLTVPPFSLGSWAVRNSGRVSFRPD